MQEIIDRISQIGVVPVIRLENAQDAADLAGALTRGGLPCAEVTFRTAAAADSIAAMHKAYPDLLIGAGTVLTPEQADTAIACGARFIVSPGLNPKTVQHCLKKGYPVLPGVCTPSEVEAGLDLGLQYLKFFPAEAAGGVKMIRAMAAPYGNVRFMPTGGVNTDNLKSYLDCKAVFACGGSWMVPGDLLKQRAFDKIEALVRTAAELIKELKA